MHTPEEIPEALWRNHFPLQQTSPARGAISRHLIYSINLNTVLKRKLQIR
jgi:hypothetical protein